MTVDLENAISNRTIGQAVVEHPAFLKQLHSGRDIEVTVSRKDITGVSAAFPATVPVAGSSWNAGLAVRGRLVPVVRTTAGAITFAKETSPFESPDGIAAIVAEGALKPEGTGGVWTGREESVKTFAVTFKISRQVLDDLPYLADLITQRYMASISRLIDQEIVAGTGGVSHFYGLLPQVPAAPAGGGSTMSAIGAAYAALGTAGYIADGLILSAGDFGVLTASNTLGLPVDFDPATQTVWGMRVAVLAGSALTGSFILGAFAGNSLLAEREEINSEIAFENENDFTYNLAAVKVEERSAFALLNPSAFRKGTIGT